MTAPIDAPTLRAVTDSDQVLLRRWLGEPHVAAWFGGRAAAEATLALATEDAGVGAERRMVIYAGRSIGYVQAVPGATDGTLEADILIGDPAMRGRGLGASALRLLADELFATTLLTDRVIVRIAVAHEAAIRAVEQAGFAWTLIEHEPVRGACWTLVRTRRQQNGTTSQA